MKTTLFVLFTLAIGQVAVAQGLPVIKYNQCPTGTYSSGGSCVPQDGNQVYYNGGGPCPQGWTSSKGYCVR
jgi:hypothetical protein